MIKHYESALFPARQAFSTSIHHLLDQCDEVSLGWFLLYFCSQGVNMTEPVDSWIRRAGEQCIVLNYTELGQALIKHAKQEANHHHYMIKDTVQLIKWWNKHQGLNLTASDFLKGEMLNSVKQYQQFHEATIQSNTPFNQLAIEYEIEKLSINHGPPLIKRCIKTYGLSILTKMSFIRHHVQLDQWHTRWNQRQLSRLLDQTPTALDALISAGIKAVECYQAFLMEIAACACSLKVVGVASIEN